MNNSWTLNDLATPTIIILGAALVGLFLEFVVRRMLDVRANRHGWTVSRTIVRTFRGLPALWLALIALHTQLDTLPLLPKAEQLTERIITVLAILSLTYVIARIGTVIVRHYSSRSEGVISRITILENLVRVIVYIFGLLTVFHTIGISVTPILTALGVGGLAVALALQDTLSNLFAGLYIIVSKQIDPGDYIKLESGQEGTIIDIAWRVTTIRTPSNTMVIIPNAKFASSILTNFDRPEKISNITIPFVLKITNDVDAVSKLLLEAAQEALKENQDADHSFTPVVRFAGMTDATVTIELVLRTTEYRAKGSLIDAVTKSFYSRLIQKFGSTSPLAVAPQ